jgi:hypothetical protein
LKRKWLIENRSGGYYWTSTKILLPLSMPCPIIYIIKELSPDYNVKVYMNIEKLCEFNAGKDDVGKNFLITTKKRKKMRQKSL